MLPSLFVAEVHFETFVPNGDLHSATSKWTYHSRRSREVVRWGACWESSTGGWWRGFVRSWWDTSGSYTRSMLASAFWSFETKKYVSATQTMKLLFAHSACPINTEWRVFAYLDRHTRVKSPSWNSGNQTQVQAACFAKYLLRTALDICIVCLSDMRRTRFPFHWSAVFMTRWKEYFCS